MLKIAGGVVRVVLRVFGAQTEQTF